MRHHPPRSSADSVTSVRCSRKRWCFSFCFSFSSASRCTRPAGVAHIRRRARGWSRARVHADGHVDHTGNRCGSNGAPAGHRQTPRRDSQLRQRRHSVQRQDGHTDAWRDAVGGGDRRSRRERAARPRARRGRRALSERHPQSPRRRHPRCELAAAPAGRSSTRFHSTSSDGACRSRSSTTGETLLVCKGAPEHVLAVCASFFAGGESQPLDDDARTKAVAAVHDNGSRGLRTLAVAWRALPRREAYGPSDETELTLGGWLTFSDPPMDDADAMVAALARDGVALKILTGDDDAVAHHVCSATGIDTTHDRARHGARQNRRSGARRAGGAHDALRARFTATEAADHSCAQGARARRGLHRRRHQRRPVAARCRRGNLGGRRGRRREGRGRHHPARPRARRRAHRNHRRAQSVRQRDEVSAHGHELELRQHVQHGSRVADRSVPPDAANADSPQQLSLRSVTDRHPERSRRRRLHPEAASLGHGRSAAIHDSHLAS